MKTLRLIRHHLGISKMLSAILLSSSIAMALSESIGVSLLFPILQFVEEGNQVFQKAGTSVIWHVFLKAFNTLHIPFNLGSLLVICFIPILLKQVFSYVNLRSIAKAQFDSIARLQSECFDQLLHSDLSYTMKSRIGVFISTLTLEIVRAGQTVSFFFKLLTSVILLSVYSLILCFLSLKLTVLIVATGVIIQFMIRHHMIASALLGQKVSEGNDLFGHAIAGKLSSLRLIKLHNTEAQESKLLKKIADDLSEDQIHLRKKNAVIQVTIEPTLILGCFLSLYVAIVFFGMNLASVGLFLFILMRMLPLLKEVNSLRQELKSYIPSFQNVSEVMESARRHREIVSGPIPFTPFKKSIVFNHVEFAHDPRKPILSDLSMTIPAGKTIAVVGQSGAGKSTIADLIVRLRDPQKGEILFDDIHLKEIDLISLRQAVGFVSQEAILLNDTLLKNITYGLPSASLEEIERSLKMSHMLDFVQSLPDGLNTIIGDRGAMMSGGERQRLCLARALLRKPTLLILDEPTSSLDAESEKFIQETIKAIHHQLTVLIITHKFSAIKEADQIFVLDNGSIVASGSHADLIEKNSLYNQLFTLQLAS